MRDLPDAQARMAQIGNLDPLVLRQEPRADPTHSQPLQRRYKPDDLTAAVRLITTRPVVPRRTGNADLTSGGENAPPSFTQLHEPLTLAIIHHNQSGATDPLQVVMASKAFPAVARSVHIVGPDPDDEASNRRLFGRPKTILVVLIFLHLAS
jgi:hypothetical protein